MSQSWFRRRTNRPIHSYTTRSRLRLEELEPRIVLDTRTLANGLTFVANGAFSDTSLVQVGKTSAGQFGSLMELHGVEFNADGTHFSTKGEIDAIAGSGANAQVLPLLNALTDGSSYTFDSTSLLSSNGLSLSSLVSGGSTSSDIANVSVAGVNFTLSTLQYSGSTLKLQGSIQIPKLSGLTLSVTGSNYVTFDTSTFKPSLTGLAATLQNASFSVAGLQFTASTLTVGYTAATATAADKFTMYGSGKVTLAGHDINIGLGTSASPGIVVQSGSLTTFQATLSQSSSMTIGGLSFTPSSLLLSYQAGTGSTGDTIGIGGAATFALKGNSVTVNLGDATAGTAGLVIQNGQVTSFDASVTSDIVVAGLHIKADSLEMSYDSSTSSYTVTGSAEFTLEGNTVGVSFAKDSTLGTNGLVITNGQLQSLDIKVTSNVSVGGLTFATDSTDGLRVIYVAASTTNTHDTLAIRGGASFSFKGNTIGVSFPDTGLVIQDGALQSLDVEVDGTIKIASVEFGADNLHVAYTPPTGSNTHKVVTITGGAHFTLNDNTISVNFGGDGKSQGLVIQDGSLQSLNMTVSADFRILSLSIGAKDLTVVYVPSPEEFELFGSLTISSGDGKLNSITADLGDASDPGIVIQNGSLTSLNIGVDGSFQLFGLTIAPKSLTARWDSASSMLALSGGVDVQLTSDIGGSVSFPAADAMHAGLVIHTDTGQVQVNGLEFTLDVSFGPFAIHDLDVKYIRNTDGTTTISASGTVDFPGGFGVEGDLTISNGQLTDIDLAYDAGTGSGASEGIALGDTGLFLTHVGGGIHHLDDLSQLEVDASVRVNFGPSVTFLGHTVSLFEADGSITVTKDDLKLSGHVALGAEKQSDGTYKGYIGDGTATLDLNWTKGEYSATVDASLFDGTFTVDGSFDFNNAGDVTIRATASLQIPKDIPFIGGTAIASGGFYFQVRPELNDPSQDYAAAYIKLPAIGTVGFKYDFNKTLTFLNADSVASLGDSPQTPDPGGFYLYTYDFTVPANVSLMTVTIHSPALETSPSDPNFSLVGRDPGEYFTITPKTGSNASSTGSGVTFNVNPGVNKARPDPVLDGTNGDRVIYIGSSDGSSTLVAGTYRAMLRSGIILGSDLTPTYSIAYRYQAPTLKINVARAGTASANDAAVGLTPTDAFIGFTGHSYATGASTVTLYYDTEPLSYYQARGQSGYQGAYIGTVSFPGTAGAAGYTWHDFVRLARQPYDGRKLYVYGVIDDGQNAPVYSAYSSPLVPPNPAPAFALPPTQLVSNFGRAIDLSGRNAIQMQDPLATSLHVNLTSLDVSVPSGQLRMGNQSGQDISLQNVSLADANRLLRSIRFTPAAGTHGSVTIEVSATAMVDGELWTGTGQVRIVEPNTDLTVKELADLRTPIEGSTVHVTVQVTNTKGPGALVGTGVQLLEALPAGLTLVSATPSVGTYDSSSGTWHIGNLRVGATARLALVLTVNAGTSGQSLLLSGQASGNQVDGDLTDNFSTLMLNVRDPILVTTSTADALQQALATANSMPGPSFIRVTAPGTISLPSTLVLNHDLRIDGPGAGQLTIRTTGNAQRVFVIGSHANVTLDNLTIAGGGIDNGGNLVIRDASLGDNRRTGDGGAIYNRGTLSVQRTNLDHDTATRGGGIFNDGTLTVDDSTLHDDAASGKGGAIYNGSHGSTTIANSTFANNSAANGGAIDNEGKLGLIDITLASNRATGNGGAILAGRSLTVRGSIVAGDQAHAGSDIYGALVSQGHNLIGITDQSSGWLATDLLGSLHQPLDPRLGRLADNGGETLTMLPHAGSPVIDAGDPTPVETTDQRGLPRSAGQATDIGAVEVQLAMPS
jgi:uncharacterized repeat protein (TIGR01451 family)